MKNDEGTPLNFLGPHPAAIFCDFDGTITQTDATDAVLERFALPAWRDWETLWTHGEISSQTCLSRQIELIRAKPEELFEFAAALPIDEGILALDRSCRAYNVPLTILSDGLDLVIRVILRKHGLLHIPIIANHLHLNAGGDATLSYPHARQDCAKAAGTCKCAHATSPLNPPGPTVYIGDGRSDYCVSDKVNVLYAKGELQSWCALQKRPHHPFNTLDEVATMIFPKGVLI